MRPTIPYSDHQTPHDFDAFIPATRPGIVEHDDAADDPNCARSIGVGVILGLIVGALMGVALLLYVDSVQLNHWPWALSIIASSAFGWALFGMIVGSGGVFSRVGLRRKI